MSQKLQYEPAFESLRTLPGCPGNFDIRGGIKHHDTSDCYYLITPKDPLHMTASDRIVTQVLVPEEIYDLLGEKFTTGQQVVATVHERNVGLAWDLRSLPEKEKAEGQAEPSQSLAGQAGSSQSQAGS